ncbi:MAG: helix-turn-helix domain-containing protein, partial [Limisphaerales bacterium]
PPPPLSAPDRSPPESYTLPPAVPLAEAEDLLIQRALEESGGNIADAARRLGIHRTRIYRRLARDPDTEK